MNKKNSQIALGIDIGGTKILSAAIDAEGSILARDQSPTPAGEGPDSVLNAILVSAASVLKEARLEAGDIFAIGIGAPGVSDPLTGVLFTSPHLPGWKDIPLRDIVRNKFDTPAFLANDANAAALGELYFGAGRGSRNFIYVTISTGIGGGIIIDGEIYTGANGAAGEIGHMTIDDKGPACNCGNRGCWETLASGTALAREARNRLREGALTKILSYAAGGDPLNVDARAVNAAAVAGDTVADEIIANTGYYIGVGLGNLINIFNPDLIVIGGGLSQIGERLLRPAYLTAGKRAFSRAFEAVRFERAVLGNDSGVFGAAAYAFAEMKRQKI